jgi:hypothetical protein
MQNSSLIIVSVGQLLTAVIVAGVGCYFAYHQKKIAKAKLRLDLFDKRFAVFNAAGTFLGTAIALGKVSRTDEAAFMIATLHASFLLSEELGSYLEEMLRRTAAASLIQSELEDARTDEEREKAKARFLTERQWLSAQINVLSAKFRPFLQLHE